MNTFDEHAMNALLFAPKAVESKSQFLAPCPFCGHELAALWDRKNPSARCSTESCKGAQLPLLDLDRAEDIAAWNRRSPAPQKTAAKAPKLAFHRFVKCEAVASGQRYRVGAGDQRAGLCGTAVAIICLKHSPGYEVVLHLDNGKQDSFAPMQLFPELERKSHEN